MSATIEPLAKPATISAQRLLLRELWQRGRWIFIAMLALQCAFALLVLGIKLPYSNYWVLPMMMLGLLPLLGPNQRLLQSLPIDKKTIDRMQWLYNGGFVAVAASSVNTFTLLGVFLFGPSIQPINALLLLFGTPAAIGLFMPLRRWTTSGVKPSNQNRPLLLANYLAVPLVLMTQTLIRIGQFEIIPVIAIALLATGWIFLLRYLISPTSYNCWIEKTGTAHSSHDNKKSTAYSAFPPRALIAIATFCIVLSVASALAPSSPEIAISVAVMQIIWVFSLLPSIKVIRSVPRSLTMSAGIIFTIYLGVPFASLFIYATAMWVFHAVAWSQGLSFALPVIGIIAPIAPVAVRLSLRGNLKPTGWVRTFVVLVMIVMLAAPWLINTINLSALLMHCIAFALIIVSFFWLRHEIRHGAMMYRYQNSVLGAWAA